MKIKSLIVIVYFLLFACVDVMAGDFYDNGDGTVTDNNTGLMWQQDGAGSAYWEGAISDCEGLALAGYSDWRLPNVRELETITDDTLYDPAIDTTFFPNVYSMGYWSSTTYTNDSSTAFYVQFGAGYVSSDSKSHYGYFRCVRGGGTTPTVTTGLATSVTSSSAILNGTVNPNGDNTTYYFEYGLTTSYGSNTTSTDVGSGTIAVPVSDGISGLSLGTTYHFRIVATNSVGTRNGLDQTFITEIDPPTVTTDSATSVTSGSATLNGTVNPNGASTTYYFQYGLTTNYGSNTSSTGVGSGTTPVSVSDGISGLSPGITYHFRIVAMNGGGTNYGSDQTFITTTNRAYVANMADDTVSVIDIPLNEVMYTIAVGDGPYAVAVHPDQDRAYVANAQGDTVSIIDTTTDTVISTLGVGDNPQSVAVNPVKNKAYVANPGAWGSGNDTVTIINTTTNQIITTVSVGQDPKGIAVADSGNASGVFVALMSGEVRVIDVTTNIVDPTPITVPGADPCPSGIAYQAATYRMYVLHNTCNVAVTARGYFTKILATTKAVDGPYQLGAGGAATSIAVDPGVGGNIYVTHPHQDTLTVTEYVYNSLEDEVTVGDFPTGVAFDGPNYRVYVTNNNDNNVSVINSNTNIVVDTIAVGSSPRGIAVMP